MSLHRLLQYNNETCYAETFKIRTHENKLFVDSLHQWHIKIRRADKDHKYIFEISIYPPILWYLIC